MHSSRTRQRAQPPHHHHHQQQQQQRPALNRNHFSPQSTVRGTLRGASIANSRCEEDNISSLNPETKTSAKAQEYLLPLRPTCSQRATSRSFLSMHGSRETEVDITTNGKEFATASSSPSSSSTISPSMYPTPLSIEHELAETQRELKRLQMQLRRSSNLERQREEYISGLEATVDAQRRDNLLLRHHLARRQLLAEALQEDNRALLEAQQRPITPTQPLITHNSTGTMTVAPTRIASGIGSEQPSPYSSGFHMQLPERQSNFAGTSPPLSPTQSMSPSYHHTYRATQGPHEHELPLHSPKVTAIHDRWAQTQLAHTASACVSADPEELPPLQSLLHQHRTAAKISPTHAHYTTRSSFASQTQPLSVDDESLFSRTIQSSASQDAHTVIESIFLTTEQTTPQEPLSLLRINSAEIVNATENSPNNSSHLFNNEDTQHPKHHIPAHNAGSALHPLHRRIVPYKVSSTQGHHHFPQHEAEMAALRDEMEEQAAEMAALREALAEARRGSTAAGATLRDGADVQALRDQMAVQESEISALREEVAEQESEMSVLRQALAEARRGSTAAGATLLDGGADVQAHCGRVAEHLSARCSSVALVDVDADLGAASVVDQVDLADELDMCGDVEVFYEHQLRGSLVVCKLEDGCRRDGCGGDRMGGLGEGFEDGGGSVRETEVLRSALTECKAKIAALQVEVRTAREAVEELRWYDERRDNCVEGKPLCQTHVECFLEGSEWSWVVSLCEEELKWRLRVDCSRACHVNVDCVRLVGYVLGSLRAEFCVEHNTDVDGSELKDRVAEYPFPSAWALFRRLVGEQKASEPLLSEVHHRAAQKLFSEEALGRVVAQLEEAYARQAFTSERSEQKSELLRAAASALAKEVVSSRWECTDRLERLEELAVLLLEARESERELRDRLFAAEESIHELHRRHDDDRDGLVSAEAEKRRSLDACVARVASQDETIRVQAEQIVGLQELVQALSSALSEKNADLISAHAQAVALSREVDEKAAAYTDTLEKLEKCVEMLELSRTNELVLSQTLYEAEHQCTQLRGTIEIDAASHQAELVSATAERDRLKEGMEVLRELLPLLLGAAEAHRQEDSGDAGAGVDEGTITSALDASFSLEGYVAAQELREVLLCHLSCVEQLRRDKEVLADELVEAEKARGDYAGSLEEALQSLMEERELRMRTYESQLQFSEQMMRELAMMRNAEEDEMVDEKADMEVNSSYELPSIRSSSPAA